MTVLTTLHQAEAARSQHSDDLAKRGAHAVGVEQRGGYWEVVVQVEPGQSFDAPTTLTTRMGAAMIDVPLRVERSSIATPQ